MAISSFSCFRVFAVLLAIFHSVFVFAECPAVPGADSVLWKPGIPVIWVGETHGTKETPAAFGDLVCDALEHGKNVTVGLEFMSQSQTALDALVGPGDVEAAKKEVLTSSHSVDGRDDCDHGPSIGKGFEVFHIPPVTFLPKRNLMHVPRYRCYGDL